MKNIKVAYIEPCNYFPHEISKKHKLGEFSEEREFVKFKSVMIGHAIGDALGVPAEYSKREDLQKHPITSMEGYGAYDVPAGSWSDDTSMSIATMDAMCRKDWGYDDIMNNFVDWIDENKFTPGDEVFDVGHTCLAAIKSYVVDGTRALQSGQDGEYSNGNGALMRIHPFVLYARAKRMAYGTWRDLIEDGSRLTHANEVSRVGCLIYTFVLMHLLNSGDKEQVREGLKSAERHLKERFGFERYSRIFAPDFEKLSMDEIKSSGYVVDTLEAALWCLLTTDSYSDCVLRAVNLGSDADTVAAVAGGLAGALYGYDNIPVAWLDTLVRREYIEGICLRAYVAWKD